MGASENPCEEVCVGGLGEGENYIWCLVIVAIFMGLGGPKRCGGGGKWVGQVTKWEVGVAIFMGKEELASLDTTKKIFVYLHCYQFNKTAAVIRSQN